MMVVLKRDVYEGNEEWQSCDSFMGVVPPQKQLAVLLLQLPFLGARVVILAAWLKVKKRLFKMTPFLNRRFVRLSVLMGG